MANPRYDQGSVIQLSNGTYLMGLTVYTTDGGDASAAIINFYTSTTLSGWVLLSSISSPSGIGYYIPSLFLKANGDVLTIFIEKPTTITSRLLYVTSTDSGATWSSVSVIRENANEYLVSASNRILQTNTGRLIFGTAKNTNGILDSTNGNYTGYVYYSDDEGVNWSVSASTMVSPDNLCVEQGAYIKDASTLTMYCRNRSATIYAMDSSDNGTTWGSVYSIGVPAIDSESTIQRLNNGMLLVVYNTPDRKTIKMSYSPDNGSTWLQIKTIATHTTNHFIEPFIVQVLNIVHIFYARSNATQTLFSLYKSSFNTYRYF